eukprot:s2903_g4.t1
MLRCLENVQETTVKQDPNMGASCVLLETNSWKRLCMTTEKLGCVRIGTPKVLNFPNSPFGSNSIGAPYQSGGAEELTGGPISQRWVRFVQGPQGQFCCSFLRSPFTLFRVTNQMFCKSW